MILKKEDSKKIHAKLKVPLSNRFEIIKTYLDIQNDAEVIRFLVQHYYKENLEDKKLSAQEELERDRDAINKFMEKYVSEWRQLGEE